MPGHKGKLDAFDLTEVPGADSLYEAQGVIAQSEEAMAACYGALETAYSAGGSTLCIQAMLAWRQRLDSGFYAAGIFMWRPPTPWRC